MTRDEWKLHPFYSNQQQRGLAVHKFLQYALREDVPLTSERIAEIKAKFMDEFPELAEFFTTVPGTPAKPLRRP